VGSRKEARMEKSGKSRLGKVPRFRRKSNSEGAEEKYNKSFNNRIGKRKKRVEDQLPALNRERSYPECR